MGYPSDYYVGHTQLKMSPTQQTSFAQSTLSVLPNSPPPTYSLHSSNYSNPNQTYLKDQIDLESQQIHSQSNQQQITIDEENDPIQHKLMRLKGGCCCCDCLYDLVRCLLCCCIFEAICDMCC